MTCKKEILAIPFLLRKSYKSIECFNSLKNESTISCKSYCYSELIIEYSSKQNFAYFPDIISNKVYIHIYIYIYIFKYIYIFSIYAVFISIIIN